MIALLLVSPVVSANNYLIGEKTTSVYCSNQYGGPWKWLHGVTAEGEWAQHWIYDSTRTKLFHIDKEQYWQLVDMCKEQYPYYPFPRPAKNIYTNWYSFAYWDDNHKTLIIPDLTVDTY